MCRGLAAFALFSLATASLAATPASRPAATPASMAATQPTTCDCAEHLKQQMRRKVDKTLPEALRRMREDAALWADMLRRREEREKEISLWALVAGGGILALLITGSITKSVTTRKWARQFRKLLLARAELSDVDFLAQLDLPPDRVEMATFLRHEVARQMNLSPLLLRPEDSFPLLAMLGPFDGFDEFEWTEALRKTLKMKYNPVVRPTREQLKERKAVWEGTFGQWIRHFSDPSLWNRALGEPNIVDKNSN